MRLTTRAELKSLHQRLRTTIIYVTHDQAEAMTLGQRICVMDKGIIQQVAPPMEVYENPVNRFVAGFLGTPPMNFFNGRIDFKQDTPFFIMNDTELELPKRLKDNLTTWQNKEMTLGIRPEHFSTVPINGQKQNTLTATVDVIEPLGDRTLIYLKSKSDQEFVANLGPHTEIKTSDSITIHINTDHVHIFEPGEMGKNIIPG
jgi:multiple sugar transport system ATP-binding protein